MSAVVIDLNDVAPIRAERPRFDVDLIVARLRDTAETWVPRLFPNGRRLADEWRLANIHGDAPRNSGSCVITLRGAHAGDWIDFDGNHGGGPISAIEEATGLTGYELIAEAAEIAGVAPGAPARQVPAFQPAPRRDPAQEIGHILAHAVPATGTPAERYLAARGLVLPGRRRPAVPPGPDPLGEQVGLPRADRRGARPGRRDHRPAPDLSRGAGERRDRQGGRREAADDARPRGRRRCPARRRGRGRAARDLRGDRDRPRRHDRAARTAGLGHAVDLRARAGGATGVGEPHRHPRRPRRLRRRPARRRDRRPPAAQRRPRGRDRHAAARGRRLQRPAAAGGRRGRRAGHRGGRDATGGRGPGADRPASTAQLRRRRHGPADHARRRGRSRARGREGLEPAARLEPHALALPLRRHPDLGRARRRGPPGRRHPDRGAPAPHAGPPRPTGGG